MSPVIDARVRLPRELRPPAAQTTPEGFLAQYDAVLDLDAKTARTFSDLEADLSGAGVDHAVIHAEYETGDGVDEMNRTVAELVRAQPQRYSGFGTVSLGTRSIADTVAQVREVASLGLHGINVQPAFHGMEIDARRLYPVYAAANELGLIVAVHTGINYARSVPMEGEHPMRLDRVAGDFPDLRLIACHAAWPWVDEMVAVARRHPTVFLEFGGLAPRYVGEPGTGWATVRRMMDSLLASQVVFATDWPVMEPFRCLAEWRSMGLKEATLERLLGGTMADLLAQAGTGGAHA